MSDTPKEIKVVTGNGDLEISQVHKHLSSIGKPKAKEKTKKEVIIPKEKKKQTNEN